MRDAVGSQILILGLEIILAWALRKVHRYYCRLDIKIDKLHIACLPTSYS